MSPSSSGLLFLSILINILLLSILVWQLWRHIRGLKRRRQERYDRLTGHFKLLPIQSSDIVFLGDSITAGADWQAMFPQLAVRNLGIGGDTASGVYSRLDSILEGSPKKVFLLIGTNDIGPKVPYAQTATTVRLILQRFQECTPTTMLFVQSVLPRQASYRREVELLNQTLRILADEYGATYIDLYSQFIDENGGLKQALSNDNLHLLGAGYQLWQQALRPYL